MECEMPCLGICFLGDDICVVNVIHIIVELYLDNTNVICVKFYLNWKGTIYVLANLFIIFKN